MLKPHATCQIWPMGLPKHPEIRQAGVVAITLPASPHCQISECYGPDDIHVGSHQQAGSWYWGNGLNMACAGPGSGCGPHLVHMWVGPSLVHEGLEPDPT